MVNGTCGGIIMPKRGLRQGGPLSLLLFVLAANIFTKTLKLGNRNCILQGLSPFNFSERLLSFNYADNTLLLVNTDYAVIGALNISLYGFEFVPGLKINFNKSFCVSIR